MSSDWAIDGFCRRSDVRRQTTPVWRWALVLLLGFRFTAAGAQDAPAGRIGRAIVAGLTPNAVATYPDKTAHDYPKGRLELREGLALSELHTLETDKDGRLCLVLTPGALVCVRPSTSLKLDRLEQMTDGLPEQGKDLLRRMELTLTRGATLVHAGVPSANTMIRVTLPVGTVEANGGEFVLVEDKGSWLVGVEKGPIRIAVNGTRVDVTDNKVVKLVRDAAGKGNVTDAEQRASDLVSRFDMCTEFFPDLEGYVFRTTGVDLGGLESWIGAGGGIRLAGDPTLWTDVTPSARVVPPSPVAATGGGGAPAAEDGRWPRERIWEWYRACGVIRGVNYLPRTAVNSLEFWQAGTFDTNVIGEELAWARDAGFNSVRVPLQVAAWSSDPAGFKGRFAAFLKLASAEHLSVVPVLFDDASAAGTDPVPGKQPDPLPGVHNSRWIPSPGPTAVRNRSTWADLERYVRDITGGFRRDDRILFWDLYNNPGGGGMGDQSLALLESTFRWARQEKTRQPLTAAVWGNAGDAASARLMELSDLVTFQAFDSVPLFRARLAACEAAQRPVVCTDWLKRQAGNTFQEILPVLADRSVGWYSRGLVQGRAQFFVQDGRAGGGKEPAVWQQDVLRPDGKPYDRKEIELIKAFQFIK